MNMPDKQIYRFADVEVDARRGYLWRGGEERRLRQKTFQVLVYLIEHRDGDISKDDLIKDVWKDTAVVDDVLVQSIKDIRRALGDDTRRPRFVRTIPKFGYRFIGTIEEIQKDDLLTAIEEPLEIEAPRSQTKDGKIGFATQNPQFLIRSRFVLIAVFLFAVISIVLGFVGQNGRQFKNSNDAVAPPNESNKKSLVVMFFENQSNNQELDWLREGLADMLITDLSRSTKLTILSRQQFYNALERNGYAPDARISPENALEIAGKSRAEMYIVGSFAALGEAIRLDAKLYDGRTGELRAAETLTVEKPEQIFTEIDLLSIKLLNRLDALPFEPEKPADISNAMTGNLEAYRNYSLAVDEAQAFHNKEAIALLEKAVALDPQFAMAYARIGYTYAVAWNFPEKAKPFLEKAFALSDRLTGKDRLQINAWYSIANLDYPNAVGFYRQIIAQYPLETESYLRLGNLLSGEEKNDEAIAVLKQGLAIDADASLLYNALGNVYSISGRHDEAIAAHRRYVALAPQEANACDSLGMSYQWAGLYADAINEFRRARELNPKFEIAVIHLANANFQTGRYRAAIDLYKKYIEIAPSEIERARGFSAIARVDRRLKNFDAAAKAARQANRENALTIDELWLIASERGDQATANALEEKLFAEPSMTNRGKRILSRYKFYFKGVRALENRQPAEALENFKEAIGKSPPTYEADALEDCLAAAYSRLDQLEEAAAEYERILRLNPNYPLAQFHLAQIYERQGQTEKAFDAYQKFLQIWNEADAEIPEVAAAKKILSKS